jgi:hypothetical protein
MLKVYGGISADESEELSCTYGAELLSLCVLKEQEHPVGACWAPAWQVRESGSGFSTGLLSGRKGIDIPVDARWHDPSRELGDRN